MTTYKVGYIVGSLATASINRTLAKALIRLAPPELEFVEIDGYWGDAGESIDAYYEVNDFVRARSRGRVR